VTKRQSQILEFIRQFMRQQGYSPSLRLICENIGVSALSTVHKHLVALEKGGQIVRQHGRACSITLVTKSTDREILRERERVILLVAKHWPYSATKKYQDLIDAIAGDAA
jgi:SOS-response transcriptional repressor LexA